jgi:hypothetical protein
MIMPTLSQNNAPVGFFIAPLLAIPSSSSTLGNIDPTKKDYRIAILSHFPLWLVQ